MDLYHATFACSILLNSVVLYQSHRTSKAPEPVDSDKVDQRGRIESDREALSKLKRRFFPIYLLVNAADWLQGPYIYPIYKGNITLWISHGTTA